MLHEEHVAHLSAVAQAALPRWIIPAHATVQLISLSENGMFLVSAGTARWALRVHRTGYHTIHGVRSELAWMQALQANMGLETPQAIAGRDGEFIQLVAAPGSDDVRMVALFEFIPGREPNPEDLVAAYPQLGEISARMHLHARQWQRPDWFERQVWDYDGALGSRPNWGHWQAGFAAHVSGQDIVERADAAMKQRLQAFGKDPYRFGLIHSDLRLANLLVDEGRTKVIDFDDCGFGWFLYDLASAVTFLETHPDVDAILGAWLDGYRTICDLSSDDIAAIPTFMMFRRLIIMGWAGSHAGTELARWMGDQYTVDTVVFADRYLSHLNR